MLITYTHRLNIEKVHDYVEKRWEGAKWPLLLVLIDFEENKKFWSGRKFKNIQMSIIDHESGERSPLRVAHALPWEVEGTRWGEEALK